MQILIDWEDPISKSHVLAVATLGIAGPRHMVRVAATEPVSTILEALQDWADEARKSKD